MALSIIEAQRSILLDTVRNTGRGEWKVLIQDAESKRLINNVLTEDDILGANITNIEQIEDRRAVNRDIEALYILSPQPHIVDCVMADFERRRYRAAYLVWTGLLLPQLRERIDRSGTAREQIRSFKVLNVEYFPRESHLVTFRDPWSFPVLYHPACNNLVRAHMEAMAQKIVGVCVALGEYPIIRYYKPQNPRHEASVLCSHLAGFVQDELDLYAKFHQDFPPPSNRPRGALYVTDRSMDLCAPLLHEFTYQAMAHDLLPIKEGDHVTYKTTINEGRPDQEVKEIEITEKDKIWVDNRHRHMKDTIDKLMGDFQRFIEDNPHFANANDNTNSLSVIKDMMAGLPQFQEMKEAYSLHLSMAQESMNLFQEQKLPDLAAVEQILATGLDEDSKKPKNVADQVVRNLDEDSVPSPARLRLIALYVLFKDGLVPADLQKLLAHANLPPQDGEVIHNMDLLGARVHKPLKDKSIPQTLFPRKSQPTNVADDLYTLSRFEPALRILLEEHARGGLDSINFPYVRPPLEEDMAAEAAGNVASLRSKPTWAKSRSTNTESRQRVIVFMAGGATFSESRACYELSNSTNREIVMVTSHMQNPGLFVRQLGDLSVDKRRLGIPMEQPKPKAPAHLFEELEALRRAAASAPTGAPGNAQDPRSAQPPTAQMAGMRVADGRSAPSASVQNGMPQGSKPSQASAPSQSSKLTKDHEKKKKHGFFSSKK